MTQVTYFVRMTAKAGQTAEVKRLLRLNFANVQREPGNVVFALHRSRDHPDEFWNYETWADQAAVDAHERSAPFLAYRETIRPLVDGETVIWGNTAPFAVNGYDAGSESPPAPPTTDVSRAL